MVKGLMIGVYVAICLVCCPNIAFADSFIGIILDGYQKDCFVTRNNHSYECAKARYLYSGDIVVRKPTFKALSIKWAPYASPEWMSETTRKIVFQPPQVKKGFTHSVKEWLGFVTSGLDVSVTASRGEEQAGLPGKLAQPNRGATLLAGQKTTFLYPSVNRGYLVCHDAKGQEVFRRNYGEDARLELSPEDMGMSAGRTYSCGMNSMLYSRRFELKLLPADIAALVKADLAMLENDSPDDNKKFLRKAFYLQFISQTYPREINLYWLSYMMLERIADYSKFNESEKLMVEHLFNNYRAKLDGGR